MVGVIGLSVIVGVVRYFSKKKNNKSVGDVNADDVAGFSEKFDPMTSYIQGPMCTINVDSNKQNVIKYSSAVNDESATSQAANVATVKKQDCEKKSYGEPGSSKTKRSIKDIGESANDNSLGIIDSSENFDADEHIEDGNLQLQVLSEYEHVNGGTEDAGKINDKENNPDDVTEIIESKENISISGNIGTALEKTAHVTLEHIISKNSSAGECVVGSNKTQNLRDLRLVMTENSVSKSTNNENEQRLEVVNPQSKVVPTNNTTVTGCFKGSGKVRHKESDASVAQKSQEWFFDDKIILNRPVVDKANPKNSLQKINCSNSADALSVDSNVKRDGEHISKTFKRIGRLLLILKQFSKNEKQGMQYILDVFSKVIRARGKIVAENRSFIDSHIQRTKEIEKYIENTFKGQMFENIRNLFLLFIKIKRECLSILNEYLCKSQLKREKIDEMLLSLVAVNHILDKYYNLIEDIHNFLHVILDDIKRKSERDYDSDKNTWNEKVDEMKKKLVCSQVMKHVKNQNVLSLLEQFNASSSEILSELKIPES